MVGIRVLEKTTRQAAARLWVVISYSAGASVLPIGLVVSFDTGTCQYHPQYYNELHLVRKVGLRETL